MNIPIQNIYYLLCYAWNRLEEKDLVDVKGIDSTRLVDLFAKVLIGGVTRLFKSGIDRDYVEVTEQIRGIKGKLLFGPTLKKNLLVQCQAVCEYDEMHKNVLHNQILKAGIASLLSVKDLDKELRGQLVGSYVRFHDVDDIQLTSGIFHKVRLHRNNSFYDFLLKVCQLIYENLLPTQDPGESKFRDFLRNERQMAYVFEKFVYNFYIQEQTEYNVGRDTIAWVVESEGSELLPQMQTDVSLTSPHRKIIIDTKYYRNALQEHYDRKSIHSANLYQIFAYLKNIESRGGVNTNCEGMLLYPTVTEEIDDSVVMHGHKISFKTINLNQDWEKIHHALMAILAD